MTDWLPLGMVVLIIGANFAYTIRLRWNPPPEQFTGVWLARYHGLIVACHAVELATVSYILFWRPWTDLPVLAPVDVALFMGVVGGFTWYVRRRPAGVKRRVPVAISLTPRRLRDYIRWPAELGLAAIVVLCWGMLIKSGGMEWRSPLVDTYVIAALFGLKILVAKTGRLLPAERAAEHHEWAEASRRASLRAVDFQRWFFTAILVGYTIKRLLPENQWQGWPQWSAMGGAGAIWMTMTVYLMRSQVRLAALGRDLLPAGSWVGPGGTSGQTGKAGVMWGAAFLTGLAVLFIVTGR